MSEGAQARVSVVIPTFNRCDRLHRVLTALANQTHVGEFETVVVSDGSDDGTDEYLASDRVPLSVVAVQQVNSGPATARNRGTEVATGDLILFLDDDVVPDRGLVAAHIAAHERYGERTVAIGPMRNPPDHDMSMWIRYEQAMLAKQYDAMERGDWDASPRQFYTGNASVGRAHLVESGGFDTELRRAEDIELALRFDAMGLRFVYVPEAIGLHYAERSFESWRAIGRAYGRSEVEFARRPGREDLLGFAMFHYGERRLPIRAAVRVTMGRPLMMRAADRVLLTAAKVGDRIGIGAVAQFALSGIYNIAYYDGVAEALGGRREFRRTRRLEVAALGADADPSWSHRDPASAPPMS